jgi:hypothetical protein
MIKLQNNRQWKEVPDASAAAASNQLTPAGNFLLLKSGLL